MHHFTQLNIQNFPQQEKQSSLSLCPGLTEPALLRTAEQWALGSLCLPSLWATSLTGDNSQSLTVELLSVTAVGVGASH